MIDINNESFERIELEEISEDESVIFILVKDIFKNIGVSQRYINLNIVKTNKENGVFFVCSPTLKNIDAVPISISKINIHFEKMNNHEIMVNEEIIFHEDFVFPSFLEKIFIYILKNIYKNVIKKINLNSL